MSYPVVHPPSCLTHSSSNHPYIHIHILDTSIHVSHPCLPHTSFRSSGIHSCFPHSSKLSPREMWDLRNSKVTSAKFRLQRSNRFGHSDWFSQKKSEGFLSSDWLSFEGHALHGRNCFWSATSALFDQKRPTPGCVHAWQTILTGRQCSWKSNRQLASKF